MNAQAPGAPAPNAPTWNAPARGGPRHVLPAACGLPLHGVAASRAIEAMALAGVPPGTLMRRAGLGCARLLAALAPHAHHIWVACGPGGNGGDGLHAAAELARQGRQVRVSLLADAGRLGRDAGEGLQRARAAGVEIISTPPDAGWDAALDALLGLGASRAPDATIAAAIRALNQSGAPCLAVDLPSGLHGDSGQPLGDELVHARATLSLLTLKPGLFTGAGRDAAGEIWFDALGVETADTMLRLTGEAEARMAIAPRVHQSHKGRFGDTLVIGGAPGMTGAARLAAAAAQAAGAGRTFISLLDPDVPAFDPVHPAWLWRPRAWEGWDGPNGRLEGLTVACGCGGGQAVREALPAVIAHAARLVLDADALNALADDAALAAAMVLRGAGGRASVLTPHPLEAARLLHTTTAAVQADRLGAATALARRHGAVVVLKGSGTVVASPDGHVCLNPTGNAALATGGSGDVLAGWLAGAWGALGDSAGRAAPADVANPNRLALQAAVGAVWLHGRAADLDPVAAGQPSHLVQAMRRVAFGTLARVP